MLYNQGICLLKAELIGALQGYILPCQHFSLFPKPGLLNIKGGSKWQMFTHAFLQMQCLKL